MYNKDKFQRNTISKLYNAVTATVVHTRDALRKKLQSVRDTAYLLHQKNKEKLEYGQTLKDTLKNEAEEVKKQQQDNGEEYDTVPKIKLVYEEIRKKN